MILFILLLQLYLQPSIQLQLTPILLNLFLRFLMIRPINQRDLILNYHLSFKFELILGLVVRKLMPILFLLSLILY